MEKWKLLYTISFTITYLYYLFEITGGVANLKPLYHLDLRRTLKPFLGAGNESVPEHFKVLYHENGLIYVGGRNRLYNLSIEPDGTVTQHQHLEWDASEERKKVCLSKYYTLGDCNNYVTLAGKLSPEKFIVCGTHAFEPKCRWYRTNGDNYRHAQTTTSLKEFEEKSGLGFISFHQFQNSTATIVNGAVYAATFVDLWSTEPIVYREPVRTLHMHPPALNGPQFVHSFRFRSHVYFLFREWDDPTETESDRASDRIESYRSVVSRVARVCINDAGYTDPLYDRPVLWKTYLKVRFTCRVPNTPSADDSDTSTNGIHPSAPSTIYDARDRGDQTALDFDSLVAATDPDDSTGRFYAAFVLPSPPGTVSSSVLCQFDANRLEEAFAKGIKRRQKPHDPSPGYYPADPGTPKTRAKKSHIGDCDYDYHDPDDAYYLQNHPLVPHAVVTGLPVATWSGRRPTALAVDFGFETSSLLDDVIFVASGEGKVYKVVVSGQTPEGGRRPALRVPESLRVVDSPVTGLYIYRRSSHSTQLLVITTIDRLIAVPLARCERFSECAGCRSSDDPYCSWDGRKCSSLNVSSRALDVGADCQPPLGASVPPPQEYDDVAGDDERYYASHARNEYHHPPDPSSYRDLLGRDGGEALYVGERSVPALSGGSGPVINPNYYGGSSRDSRCSLDRLSLAVVITALVTGFISCFVGYRLKGWLDRKHPGSSCSSGTDGFSGTGTIPMPSYFVMNKVGTGAVAAGTEEDLFRFKMMGRPQVHQQSIYEPPPLPPLPFSLYRSNRGLKGGLNVSPNATTNFPTSCLGVGDCDPKMEAVDAEARKVYI